MTNHKKNITIFGSYSDNSIGDKAILIGLLHLILKNQESDIHIEVLTSYHESIEKEIRLFFSKKQVSVIPTSEPKVSSSKNDNPSISSFTWNHLPAFLKTIAGVITASITINRINIENSKGLIIGGGNLLMDLFPAWPIKPYLLAKRFHSRKLPVIIAGVGALPINTVLGKILLKNLTQKAQLVFVRDKKSKEFIEKKWNKKAEYHPDFAFSYPIPKKYTKDKHHNEIAINIAPVYGSNWPYQNPKKYNRFIMSIASELHQYHKANQNVSYYFFDTNYPTDRTATLDTINQIRILGTPAEAVKYEDRLKSSLEVITQLSNCRTAVVTRLHAGVMALKTGAAVIPIIYQPKVKNVLSAAGLNCNAFVEISNVNQIKSKLITLEKCPKLFTIPPERIRLLGENNNVVIKRILTEMFKR